MADPLIGQKIDAAREQVRVNAGYDNDPAKALLYCEGVRQLQSMLPALIQGGGDGEQLRNDLATLGSSLPHARMVASRLNRRNLAYYDTGNKQ